MTGAAPLTTRRPHFRRSAPPPILIQDDDIAIIRFVYEGRFRRSTDICNFLRHRSPKKIVERLGVLYHTGYLDRPHAQRDYFSANKKRPHYIYALGNRGAELLSRIDGIEMPRVDWGDKNRSAQRPFIHHRLMISDVLTAIKNSVAGRDDIKFIQPSEILARAPVATQQLSNPWKWKAKVPRPNSSAIDTANVPDAVFGLDFVSKRVRYWYMLEADRATMPVFRSTFSKTSLHSKYLTYYHAHKAGFHTKTYNITNFRVLTCTTTPERAANIVGMIKTKIAPSNMFLVSDVRSLANARDVLTLGWTTGKGDIVRLAE